jgi:O-antigen ligase
MGTNPKSLSGKDFSSEGRISRVFAATFGAFLGLLILKFGNPSIMSQWVTPPASFLEFLMGSPWPVSWAYGLLAMVVVLGVIAAHWKPRQPIWLAALPLFWLLWQLAASIGTIEARLTNSTLAHFLATVLCFYLGYFSLSRVRDLKWFWLGLLVGFVFVLAVGWAQRFGGLAETRRYFFLYIYPTLKEVPPEYLKKLQSDRIFSTQFYPNALAGVLIMLMPPLLAFLWSLKTAFTTSARAFLAGSLAVASLACLYWSGSKGGWLLMLAVGLVALLRLPFPRGYKLGLVGLVLALGLAGFFWKYSGFFQKGATSVGARFDYWEAAIRTFRERPLMGTGPGTFGTAYQRIKRPESEPARLTHNDYLQQASDSGLPGFLTYAAFLVGALWTTYPRARHPANSPKGGTEDWMRFSVWLGLLGWALQSSIEFGLYIPALAWPAFALLGCMLGSRNRIDKIVSG